MSTKKPSLESADNPIAAVKEEKFDLFGLDFQADLFRRLLSENRLSHGYLFFGPSGVGKATFARLLGFFLERGVFKETNPPLFDSMFISAQNGVIGIDKARDAKVFLSQEPLVSPRRFLVIDGAENLTSQAESALLKIVEEPPPRSMVVFITHNPHAMSSALLSRLQSVRFCRISDEKLAAFISKKKNIGEKESLKIAKTSFGRIGLALSLYSDNGNENRERDDSLISIEKKITSLYLDNKIKNASAIKLLLHQESSLARFNLNQKIQDKATAIYARDP